MYKEALKDMIVKLDLKEKGEPLIVPEKEEDARELIIKAIEILNDSDYFSRDTTSALATLGWDRKLGWDKSKLLAPVEDIPPIENEEPTLANDIAQADLKELKDIAKSEPQFKSIRGKIASYKNVDELREIMLDLFKNPPAETVNTKQLEKLEKLIAEKKVISHPIPQLKERETSLIQTRPPFSNLFQIDKNTLVAVKERMEKHGYDNAFPLILWGDVLIDGHTRLKAALLAGIEKVPIEVKEFDNEKDALRYAIHNQRDRRNMGDAELLRCIREVDMPMSKEDAGAKGGKAEAEHIEPTHKVTAKVLGLGQSVVSDARTVLTDVEATKEVEEGKTTIRKAAKKVRAAKKKPKEKVVEPKTEVEAVVQVLRESAGEEALIPSIVERSAKIIGQELEVMEQVVNDVIEVCIALKVVKLLTGDKIAIKKILK